MVVIQAYRKTLAKRAVALMLSASLFGGTAAAFRGVNWIFDSIGLGTGETVTADGGSAGDSVLAGNGQNLTGQDGGVIRMATANSGGMDVSDIASATLPAVVAIGNAMGYGQSVTTGIVSALNRTITTGTDSSGNPVTSTYIQTDAAINPGNSGGALLNMDGQLIGINTAKVSLTEIEGMGYAIPVSQVWGTILELMGQTSGIRA